MTNVSPNCRCGSVSTPRPRCDGGLRLASGSHIPYPVFSAIVPLVRQSAHKLVSVTVRWMRLGASSGNGRIAYVCR
jgi:hypothetical protein